ncbi:MAG: serine/threonine-protein kinase [Coriobacteriia bacterium]|nr:serine/threonine-protein kinase [Coriobacteriia bacterium]
MAKPRLILDRYRPTAKAGSGGFATVYKAWDTLMQRDVAIKEIKLSELDAERMARPSILLPWEEEPVEIDPISGAVIDPATGQPLPPGAPMPNRTRPGAPARRGTGTGTATLPDLAPFPKDPAFLGGGYADVPDDPTTGPQLNVEQQRFLSHIPGLDEARTAAALDNPCIVSVYDLQIQDTTAYLIMEFVEGMSLTRFLRDFEDQLTLDMITSIFADTAQAIQAAHANGVLHLDIKPDNILINLQGRAKVTDFGLATLSDAEGTGTAGGGTIGYMPLEQMHQQPLDARTDEWALASVTYEMLLGENPFLAHDLDGAAWAIENAELVLPHLLWDELDPAIDDVLFYGLDPSPANRYETVQDFTEEMSRFLGSPDAGRRQLAALLNGQADDPEDPEPEEPDYPQDQGESKPGLLSRLLPGRRSSRADRAALPAAAAAADDPGCPDANPAAAAAPAPARTAALPPSQRFDPLALQVGSRVTGAVLCLFLNGFSLMNLPRIDAFPPELMWFLLAAGLVASLIRPHLGALAAYLILGFSLCVNGAPAFGILLIAATVPWWWLVARPADAPAHLALAFPVLGGVALSPVGACLCGLFLSPGRAVATTALGTLACLGLACLSTLSLTGWDAVTNFLLPSALAEVQVNIMAMVTTPGTWTTAASWLLAAAVLALCCMPRWRWLALVGAVLSALVLALGPVAAQLVSTSLTSLQPNPYEMVPAAVAFVVCAATCCMEVPHRKP